MKVNGKDDIPYIMENKKCLKPPTRSCKRQNTKHIKTLVFREGGLSTQFIYVWVSCAEHPLEEMEHKIISSFQQ